MFFKNGRITFGRISIALPRTRLLRTVLGILLIIAGCLGFLPILGFWMIPLGLIILSIDSPKIRRWRRNLQIRFGRSLSKDHRREHQKDSNNDESSSKGEGEGRDSST